MTYYLVHENSGVIDPSVKDQLLDVDEGAYRLISIAESAERDVNKFYKERATPREVRRALFRLRDTATQTKIWDNLETSPGNAATYLTIQQATSLSQRVDAYMQAERSSDPSDVKKAKNLKKMIWLKRGLPLVPDSFYADPTDASPLYIHKEKAAQQPYTVQNLFDYGYANPSLATVEKGRPLQLAILASDAQGDGKGIVSFVKNHLDLFAEEDLENLYLSLIYTLSSALAHNYSIGTYGVSYGQEYRSRVGLSRVQPTPQQKGYIEAILHEHHRLFNEENGNIPKVAARMKYGILESLRRDNEEIIIEHPDPLQVYHAVTEGQLYFYGINEKPMLLVTGDMYNMIEAARLVNGCPGGIPTDGIPDIVQTYGVDLDSTNTKKVIVNEKDCSRRLNVYDFSNVDPNIVQQNLLLFIYGYLEKQTRIFDQKIRLNRYSYQQSPVGNTNEASPEALLRQSLASKDPHYGVQRFYNYEPATNPFAAVIRGDQALEPDMMLHEMERSDDKLFDLSQIEGIGDTLDRIAQTLVPHVGTEQAQRIKQVVEAGCKLDQA